MSLGPETENRFIQRDASPAGRGNNLPRIKLFSATPPMETCLPRSPRSLSQEYCSLRSRSLSPSGRRRPRAVSEGNVAPLSQCYTAGSGSSSPTTVSRRSSADSYNTELMNAIEALRSGSMDAADGMKRGIVETVRLLQELDDRDKQIQALSREMSMCQREKEELGKMINQLQHRLKEEKLSRAPSKSSLKQWTRTQPSVADALRQPNKDDIFEDPLEIVHVFTESERLYLNSLSVLDSHFQQPMKMLSALEPEILPLHQLQSLFLNCSELLLLHRYLYEQLNHLTLLPRTTQLNEFFCVLENAAPSFSLYGSFMEKNRQQNLQKELRQLQQKQQFVQLLRHCEEGCGGRTLQQLLLVPTERLKAYSDLLALFHNPRVRDLPSQTVKRVDTLVRFINSGRYDLSEAKSEWDFTLEKIKLLQKLTPDRPIPLELFESNVQLLKQGPLNLVLNKKECPRFCFLFSSYIAVAERVSDQHFRIMEPGMLPLCNAQLHKSVDMEGQAIQQDLQSGVKEDLLAFRISFSDSVRGIESLFFRVARPRERKAWLETLEGIIQDTQKIQAECDEARLYTGDAGPKIAAASLEKLFQQLTSPHKFRDDFIEVFLMTHSCFTTTKDVLTALLNCIKSPDAEIQSDTSSQYSGSTVFLFNMDEVPDSDQRSSGCISASTSYYNITSDSEPGSPVPGSPATPRRIHHHPPYSPSPVIHRSNAMQPGTPRKNTVVKRGSASTSDSDVSPHTSAVVVDNGMGAGMRNAWPLDPEMGLKLAPAGKAKTEQTESNYVTFYKSRSHGDSHGSEEGDSELSDVNDDETTPRPSLSTPGIEMAKKKSPRLHRSVSDGQDVAHIAASIVPRSQSDMQLQGNSEEEDNLDIALNSLSHSEKMAMELDQASKKLQELTDMALSDFKSPSDPNILRTNDEIFNAEEDQENMANYQEHGVRRRSRTLNTNSRHSILSTNSLSEPDMSVVGVGEQSPRNSGTPAMDVPMSPQSEESQFAWRFPQTRAGSVPSCHKFLTSSPAHQSADREERFTSSVQYPSPKRVASLDRRIGKLVKRSSSSSSGSGKKTEQTAKFNSLSQGKSVSAYLGSESPQKTHKSIKRHWKDLKKKIVEKKAKTPEVQETDCPHERSPGSGTMKMNRTFRKNSISRERGMSVSGSLFPVDELHNPRLREQTSQGNTVTTVSKTFSILTFWQEQHFEDFESNPEVRGMLKDFLCSLISKNPSEKLEARLAQQLLDIITRRVGVIPPDSSFPTLLGRVTKIDPNMLDLYDWEHKDKLLIGQEIDLSKSLPKDSPFLKTLAEQLTLMEFAVYAAVQRRELLNCNWKKPDKETLAPNVCKLIRRTNEMTLWVSTEILSRETPAARATVIEHFVQVATLCYRHNDVHCALNITVALSCSAIKGLTRTWEEVDKKYRHKFYRLKEWLDYHGRCRKLRERLEQVTTDSIQKTGHIPSALPYIGAYLDQIYSLEQNSKTYNDDGLVNFAKMTKLSDMVRSVLQYQNSHFNFEPRLDVIAYVTAARRLTENELYELSLKRES